MVCTAVYGVNAQAIAFGVSFHLLLHSQPTWSHFNGIWQKRPGELYN